MKIKPSIVVGITLLLSTGAYSQEQSNSKNQGATDHKYMALTFDDGPSNPATSALLDVLKKNNAKATFFVSGSAISSNGPTLKRMIAEGHSIGNHTLSHFRLTDLDDAHVRSEIESVNTRLRNSTGKVPVLFRPPYGALNDYVVKTARANGLAIILWSISPDDSNYLSTASAISHRVVSSAQDGDIVFMHDTSQRSVDAAEMVMHDLSEKGFVFVTVEELISHQGILTAGKVYKTEYD